MENVVKIPVWKRTWFVVLALFLFPPAGIALLWITRKFKPSVRIILTVVFSLWTIFALIVGNPSANSAAVQTTQNTGTELSSDQQLINNFSDFMNTNPTFDNFLDQYYSITPASLQSTIWESNGVLKNREVTWTGTVIESQSNQLAIIKSSLFSGQDWSSINDNDRPYVFFAKKLKDANIINNFSQGDIVTVRGTISSRGSNQDKAKFNWDLTTIAITRN